MSDDDVTVEQCVEAGMYWFGRSDLEAARAWWERAVELEPDNQRARECLALLSHATPTGYRATTWSASRMQAPTSPFESASDAISEPPLPSSGLEDEPPDISGAIEPSWRSMSSVRRRPGPPVGEEVDPLEFASNAPSSDVSSAADEQGPWDEGPAVTTPMTVSDDVMFDAVADQTPLPSFERDAYFEQYPRTASEIADYLRATGDIEIEDPTPTGGLEVAETPLARAKDKYQLHDFNGVIELLEEDRFEGDDAEEAQALLSNARSQLLKMYESKIGDFSRVPTVNVSDEEVIWLNLNHRAGFILSQIDGAVTFEDLVALSGMTRLETVRVLAELIQQKIVE